MAAAKNVATTDMPVHPISECMTHMKASVARRTRVSTQARFLGSIGPLSS